MQPIQPIMHLIRRLWRHISSRRKWQLTILLILMIISSFTEIISVGAVLPLLGILTNPNRIFEHPVAQPFIKAFGLTDASQLLFPLIIAFCIAAVIAGAMRILVLWGTMRLTFAIGVDLGIKLYRSTLYQPYVVHIARNSSEIINGMGKISEVIFYILMPSLTLISAIVTLIVINSALLSIIPIIALVAFGLFGLVYTLIIKASRNVVQVNSRHIASESTRVLKSLQEGLGGIRDVLIGGTQEFFCTSYLNSEKILRRAQGSNQILSNGPRYVMEVLAMLLLATLAYVLTKRPNGITTAVPILAAIALGMQRLLPALQQVYWAWSTIHGAQASLQDALELLDQPLPDYAEKTKAKSIPFQYQISLKNISFRYSQNASWVLQNINLIIAKGSRVGFIGTTGGGKSTLLDIVMGLLQPTIGSIEIDGLPITASNNHLWQSHVAHVPQSIYLSDSSIEKNIAFGLNELEIDHERVKQAAHQAQIADLIETWPEKYQTFVGERGIQLSGGQRQRIGIARALYKQADVIIFDEATSALDNETEQAVMEAIEGLSNQVTILIIAHRLTTVKNCTQIVEISNGEVKLKK